MSKYTIIISGIDGSGKTSIINQLKSQLEKKGYICIYKWMRFNHFFVRPLHLFAKLIGLTKIVQTQNRKYTFHSFYRSRLFSKIYIFFTYIDTLLSKRKIIQIDKQQSFDFLICDRWIIDTLVDLRAKSKQHYSERWDRRFLDILPEGSKQIVILRDKKDILKIREENMADPDFLIKYEFYDIYSHYPGVSRINNTRTIKDAVDDIIKKII